MKKQKHFLLLLTFGLFAVMGVKAQDIATGLKLHYSFNNVSGSVVTDDAGGGNNGTLQNGATIDTQKGISVLSLGGSNGYLDMGANTGTLITSLEDFTVATYLYIESSTDISGNGNFAWAFSTHSACSQTAGQYVAYRVNRQRYAQSTGGWGNEKVGVEKGSAATKGEWQHVVYTQAGTVGTIYINGQVAATGTASYKPKDITASVAYNWLGRPQFSGDAYLKNTSYADFRIYDRALSASDLSLFLTDLSVLNSELNAKDVEAAKAALEIDGSAVRNNLTLPTTVGSGVAVSWNSSDLSHLDNVGVVKRPVVGQANAILTLTATFSKGVYTATKDFTITILAEMSEQDAADFDASNIDINTSRCYLLGKIQLPVEGVEGSTIKWVSSDASYIANTGDIIQLPKKGDGSKTVTLTATVSNGTAKSIKNFDICVNEEEGYVGYLFAYFTGNAATQEHIFFALSSDGYTYKTLNSGSPVIKSDTISDKIGVRDPHILRGHDGKYYMVVTDMKSSLGWSSNHGIVLLKSDDLVTWTHSKVDFKTKYPTSFSTVNRAWAPQVIYDEEVGKYMVYLSLKTPDTQDVIYYVYANADFTDLESTPKILFNHPEGKSCIDGDIIYKDGVYNLFFKTEGDGNGIKKAVSDKLTSGYVLQDRYLQQTTQAVEGSCVFKLINQDNYILMYDVYGNGRYEFTESTDLSNFTLVTREMSMDFAPRHGTVIPITQEESERLVQKWGKASHVVFGTALSPKVKPINIVTNETAKTVYIPVEYGTDISSFDPQLSASVPGIDISPKGAQDFTNGAVAYTFSLGATSKTYNVTVSVDNNPVLKGYYADPEILYSEKTGKFYLYPTSDGFDSWSGYFFKVFSSDDLVNWSDEGRIIDMHTDQVAWANGNAWAPCIIEKKINGEYKYFYYFSGGQDGGTKKIGVAVASHPTGPFTVSTSPLIETSPTGSGQQIDPDVFTDPVSGKSYIYWGNGYMAGAELNDDMVSIKAGTTKVMTPDATYREGAYVIYRDGVYYFMWSQDDTGSKNYKVRYATSNSPLGSLTIPVSNVVIQLDETKTIYGTGHHSVVQIPGKDEWYIVYHRISRPNGINKSKPGNFREVCIDKMEFDTDASIKRTYPTLEGIKPVSLSGDDTGIDNGNIEAGAHENIVYPTLVKDVVNFKLNAESFNASVVDISGRLMISKTLSSGESLSCSSLIPGLYFVVMKVGSEVYINKISKL